MKKKTISISILAATLLILASITTVVGTDLIKQRIDDTKTTSPLYEIRTQQSLTKNSKQLTTNYLGKNSYLNLFFTKQTSMQTIIQRALRFIDKNPQILQFLLTKFKSNPHALELLKEYDITTEEFTTYVNNIKSNPIILTEQLTQLQTMLPKEDTPIPLGLNDTNPIAILIIAIAILPLILVLGLLIGTITIVTCLNIANCLETILYRMWESFIQGLTQPQAG